MQIKETPLEEIWKIRHSVFWPDKPFHFIKLKTDSEGFHLGLYLENKLITVVSLFQDPTGLQFRKLATLEPYQGQGYGTHMMHFLLEYAKNKKAGRLWCNARLSKKSFYEKFGMRETGHTYIQDGINFTIMECMDW